ncbi:MAG: DegV family EDD domain-containing protein [Desulfobacteraceae bacterium]|nr:DegV family EDD domain-containing protein [Desulfobacteraceae bacterium]
MAADFHQALLTGYERLAAWSAVLDRINVFPVADGDTGRNLMITLAPLRNVSDQGPEKTGHQILFAARGNSGNIAARFVNDLLAANGLKALYQCAQTGAQNARSAISRPRAGTMLTVIDAFAEAIAALPDPKNPQSGLKTVTDAMQTEVDSSTGQIRELSAAKVVDAGALGMFVFLEGFFTDFCGQDRPFLPIHEIFAGRLKIDPEYAAAAENGFCVDAVVEVNENSGTQDPAAAQDHDSLTVFHTGGYAKIHLHTADRSAARKQLGQMGRIVSWNEDNMAEQAAAFRLPAAAAPVHLVTDAAGSISRHLAGRLGITLLESYVTVGDRCIPETCMDPEELYQAMRRAVRASTSQASDFERHQHYARLLSQHDRVLYLCVGSIYTGNYQTAMDWKAANDMDDRFFVIDTGAASGRLAAIAAATARYAAGVQSANQVIAFARNIVERCGEYIFLDELKYLAAGGRMSKTGAFFGDMLHMKPVISPLSHGAEKVGIVRNAEAQIKFAEQQLQQDLNHAPHPLLLLEYSDNRQWVAGPVKERIAGLFPEAEILLQPMSMTSGVHIGPGAWAVAWCCDNPRKHDPQEPLHVHES